MTNKLPKITLKDRAIVFGKLYRYKEKSSLRTDAYNKAKRLLAEKHNNEIYVMTQYFYYLENK